MFRHVLIAALVILLLCGSAAGRGFLPSTRRVASALALSTSLFVAPAFAFGPVEVPLVVKSYKVAESDSKGQCSGRPIIMPGQKAMEGLFPVCIEVQASVKNPEKSKTLTDVSVYGFVKENGAGNSILPNNPDFKSDAGQYAMIPSVPPGDSDTTFQFVAAVQYNIKKGEELPSLTFFKTKAISFPGGEKFKPLGDCELDPRLCGLEDDDE